MAPSVYSSFRGMVALDTFNTAVVSPIYYVMFTVTYDSCECNHVQGSYASLSPALSARLCSGNGEFMKHDEENQLPAEALCFQRQEMH
ncbi:hypothetical protein NC653_022801 [Populus alba x Populus x berolinensis]|uniref:Uncharacterized protein n=1 Tax=Populus alba x Populus x berolinensis TaxID=444605 RepID=A0AAD6QA43_9ROSI|nr:hypothetical protein NC653_022801 [Populus alba x Populus x berolinensis]